MHLVIVIKEKKKKKTFKCILTTTLAVILNKDKFGDEVARERERRLKLN